MNHKMLVERSRMVVLSSKSVQCNLRYSIAKPVRIRKFMSTSCIPDHNYHVQVRKGWSKGVKIFYRKSIIGAIGGCGPCSEYDYLYFWNRWTDLYPTKTIV